MGRRTLESIGRPLPNRYNIVLSRSDVNIEGVETVSDVSTAMLLADVYSISNGKKQFFVIGGEQIYDAFDEFINAIYLTEVFCGRINGDAKFDKEFPSAEWHTQFEVDYRKTDFDQFPFRISLLKRRKPQHRRISKDTFLRRGYGSGADFDAWVQQSQFDVLEGTAWG